MTSCLAYFMQKNLSLPQIIPKQTLVKNCNTKYVWDFLGRFCSNFASQNSDFFKFLAAKSMM
jgi:hypothetical protein